MDFLKLIQSFGDLLFEVVSWLVFYPRTLWLILRDPRRMMRYAAHEEREDPTERYPDVLSPPLTLLLTLVLMHGLELAAQAPDPVVRTEAASLILGSDQNLILFRSLIFGLLPLMAAVVVVRARALPLERRHLRAPFFAQCYLAAAYALGVSAAAALARTGTEALAWAGAAGFLLATAWYLGVQAALFRQELGLAAGRALALALQAFGAALLYALALAAVVALGV